MREHAGPRALDLRSAAGITAGDIVPDSSGACRKPDVERIEEYDPDCWIDRDS